MKESMGVWLTYKNNSLSPDNWDHFAVIFCMYTHIPKWFLLLYVLYYSLDFLAYHVSFNMSIAAILNSNRKYYFFMISPYLEMIRVCKYTYWSNSILDFHWKLECGYVSIFQMICTIMFRQSFVSWFFVDIPFLSQRLF